MENKKVQPMAPLDSPTLNGLEMQSKSSFSDKQKSTLTITPTDPSTATTASGPSAAATTASGPSAAATTASDPSAAATTTVGRVKTSIHVTALDGIVSVNSLFTMAIFIGFSLTVPAAATAARQECTTSGETVRRLIVFEVFSFSFFLFSSLIAQSLKLSINLLNNMDPTDPHKADVDPDYLKYGLLASAVGSVMGCLFLMLSVVDFIQVKLGQLSCGGKPVIGVVVLVVFVGAALTVYVCTTIYTTCFIQVTGQETTTTQKTAAQS